ncbi:MAG: 50S ribosomal protein L17 [Armatimonadetes bacterium]|nr:50S ribosomal protein L17 [Armatimonadota bacterium]
MRHRKQGRKLGLPSDQRLALLRGQVRQLFAYKGIITTQCRAKEVRRIAERLITLAKKSPTEEEILAARQAKQRAREAQNAAAEAEAQQVLARAVHARTVARRYLATHTPAWIPRLPRGTDENPSIGAAFNRLEPNRKAKITERARMRARIRSHQSSEDYISRLFKEIAPRFRDRPGGYTRIFRLPFRRGDASPMVKLELSTE